ncbi:MAG: hypothetical protein GF331_12260 [Chitinivibrionales bacterium]|nr:hypothetical protein [Chitinivibrionales bacterium]
MKELHNENGYYMLEVLVGLFLFGLMMMGLAQLGYASMLGNKTSQMMTEATALAQERLEDVKQAGFDGADNLAETEGYGSISGYELYKRETTVNTIGSGRMKHVTVTVFWSNDKHSFDLQTALSQ